MSNYSYPLALLIFACGSNEGNELEASNDYDNGIVYFVRTNLTEISCN